MCVTGPSGAGKGTVVTALRAAHPELAWSVSVTTRAPRPGEVEGVHYHFVDDAEFDRLDREGGLVEWVEIYGHRSGTPRGPIEEALSRGEEILLELDPAGAAFVKEHWPAAIVVFLRPPSPEVQRARLERRGTTGPDLERRVAEATAELTTAIEFDHIVVNDRLEDTIAAVEQLFFRTPP